MPSGVNARRWDPLEATADLGCGRSLFTFAKDAFRKESCSQDKPTEAKTLLASSAVLSKNFLRSGNSN